MSSSDFRIRATFSENLDVKTSGTWPSARLPAAGSGAGGLRAALPGAAARAPWLGNRRAGAGARRPQNIWKEEIANEESSRRRHCNK